MSNLIIYGGSFDPVHNGHIKTALAVQNEFHFERFLFLPCQTPILKKPTLASCEERATMLKLGLHSYPEFSIDLREIKRDTPSFMVETLESFRKELDHKTGISLLLGTDAFMQLPHWHRWQDILKLAHLLIIKRPRVAYQEMPGALKSLLLTHKSHHKDELFNLPHGKIFQYEAGEYDISSTRLREQIKRGKNIQAYLPESVYQYIKEQKLYHQ